MSEFTSTYLPGFAALAGLALSVAIVHAAPPDLYSVTYLDTARNVIGTGTFRVDRAKSRCVEIEAPDECTLRNRGRGRAIDVNAAVQQFNASINGREWHEQDPRATWWGEAGRAGGQQFVHRGTLYGVNPFWIFGDVDTGTRTLRMNIELSSNGNGRGTWEQSVIVSGTQPPERLDGTWSAKPLNGQ
jgi:hypothetical protein